MTLSAAEMSFIAAAEQDPAKVLDPTTEARRHDASARMREGRFVGAKAGRHQSGKIPYGYMRPPREGVHAATLVPHPEHAEVVKLIFRKYLGLRSLGKVMRYLNDNGYRTANGKQWSRPGLGWILVNDTYLGRVHFGGVRVRGQHAPIIASIVFYKARQMMIRNNKRRPRPA